MNKVDQAIGALRAAIEAEIASAERRGASQAASEMLAKMQAAIGVEVPKKRGRKLKS